MVNAQIQSQRKGKARGQHKNGKSANKPSPRPTVQTLRGLTAIRGPNAAGEVRLITSRPRGRSTPSPIVATTVQTSPPTTITTTKVTSRQRIVEIVTASSLQRGLILLEPPAKSAIDSVPAIFQQYPKVQQLYPLYPVYAGVRGAGQQHATRAKGLDLLQDEQFDSKNLDKGIPISFTWICICCNEQSLDDSIVVANSFLHVEWFDTFSGTIYNGLALRSLSSWVLSK